MTEPHDHTANLEDLLARCLPYIEEAVEDPRYKNLPNAPTTLSKEIRKAVPWLKECDE